MLCATQNKLKKSNNTTCFMAIHLLLWQRYPHNSLAHLHFFDVEFIGNVDYVDIVVGVVVDVIDLEVGEFIIVVVVLQ